MHFHASTNLGLGHGPSLGLLFCRNEKTLRLVTFAFVVTFAALLLSPKVLKAEAYLRSPSAAPLSDLNLERDLLAGSDALLERMVIPPHRPDWVLMDCSGTKPEGSAYDRIRHTLCENARQARAN